MTKKETETVLRVLRRIKDPDAHVQTAIAIAEKNMSMFAERKGQFRDQYEVDPYGGYW